jgi:hypothetical protein
LTVKKLTFATFYVTHFERESHSEKLYPFSIHLKQSIKRNSGTDKNSIGIQQFRDWQLVSEKISVCCDELTEKKSVLHLFNKDEDSFWLIASVNEISWEDIGNEFDFENAMQTIFIRVVSVHTQNHWLGLIC